MFHERTHATRPAAAAATCMRTTSFTECTRCARQAGRTSNLRCRLLRTTWGNRGCRWRSTDRETTYWSGLKIPKSRRVWKLQSLLNILLKEMREETMRKENEHSYSQEMRVSFEGGGWGGRDKKKKESSAPSLCVPAHGSSSNSSRWYTKAAPPADQGRAIRFFSNHH